MLQIKTQIIYTGKYLFLHHTEM